MKLFAQPFRPHATRHLAALFLLMGVFTCLSYFVLQRVSLPFDGAVLEWMGANRTPLVTLCAETVTYLGHSKVLMAVSVVGSVALWRVSRTSAAFFAVSMVGAGALNQGAKWFFGRPRPAGALLPSESYAFPSGHSMGTATLLVVVFLITRRQWPAWQWKVLSLGAVLTLLVGVTRVYLGVHFPSDVLAGWTLGASWVVLVYGWYRRDVLQLAEPHKR